MTLFTECWPVIAEFGYNAPQPAFFSVIIRIVVATVTGILLARRKFSAGRDST